MARAAEDEIACIEGMYNAACADITYQSDILQLTLRISRRELMS